MDTGVLAWTDLRRFLDEQERRAIVNTDGLVNAVVRRVRHQKIVLSTCSIKMVHPNGSSKPSAP